MNNVTSLKKPFTPLNSWLYGLIVFSVFLIDQLSKWIASQYLEYYQPVSLLPFFSLYLTHNSGAAFSLLSNQAGWQRWFFVGLSLVISILIIRWLYRLSPNARLTGIALSLILGGALGNLWDRIFVGCVVDFLLLHWHHYEWPVFNLADTAISIGALLIVFTTVLKK